MNTGNKKKIHLHISECRVIIEKRRLNYLNLVLKSVFTVNDDNLDKRTSILLTMFLQASGSIFGLAGELNAHEFVHPQYFSLFAGYYELARQ